MKRKVISLILGTLALSLGVFAFTNNKKNSAVEVDATYSQSVSDYYSSINWNNTGATLKTALYNKINITSAGWSYKGLWTAYQTTDRRANGTVWDIYSDSTQYQFGSSAQGASYSKEGDSYNREHMIPQSVFNEASPMVSDAHHVLPSDGYVNNRRSAYPHGNVTGSVTYTSNDGCKLGKGTGNTTVFEPMDEYKGDIARIYFYFVTCYQDKISNYSFGAFTQNPYPSLNSNFLSVYLQWAKDDPVSQKEIDRNNAIYAQQGNRNPFIDSPYAVGAIWDSSNASDYGTKGEYLTSGVTTTGVSISASSSTIAVGGSVSLSATSSDSSTITWTTSNSSVASISTGSAASGTAISVTGVAAGSATITAKATISGTTYSKTCAVTVSDSVGGGDYSILPSDLDTSYPSTATSYTSASGLAFIAYNVANYSSKVQFKKSGSYIYNTTALELGSLSFVNKGGSGTLAVYAGSTSNPSTTTISESNGSYNLENYSYFKIFNSGNSVTCDGINVVLSSSEKTISSIAVKTAPTKLNYEVGDDFDPTGLVITVNFSDSTSEDVAYANNEDNFDFSPEDDLKTTDTSVTIQYNGVSTTQAITVTSGSIQPGDDVTDTLTRETTGVTSGSTSYSSWSGKTGTSGAVYAGNSAGGNNAIQLRSSNSNSGIVTTTSGGYCTKIDVVWQSGTSTGRTLVVYGKNSAYSAASDLYNSSTRGTELGTIVYGTSSSITISGNYQYVGLKSSSGALYLSSVTFTWSTQSGSSDPTLTSITLNTTNVTTSFEVGDTFNYTGLVVTAHYSDSSSEVISTGYTVSSPDMSTSGQKTITVVYSGVQATYTITVTGTSPQPSGDYSLTSGSPYMNGVPYKMYFYSTNKSNNYYFIGSMPGYYGATSTVKSSGADVYFAQSGAGQNIYFYDSGTIKYLSIVISDGHINFTYAASEPSIKWIYDSTYECLTYTMSDTPYTFGTSGTYTTFSAYSLTQYPNSYKVKFETKDNEGAIPFATIMNDYISCNNAGTSAPTFNGFTWANFAGVYANLDSSSKTMLQSNNPSNDEVAEYVTRYDYIVGKYGTSTYSDFLERNPSPIGNHRISIFNSEILKENSLTLILIITSALTVSAVLGYFLLRKKKQK